MPKKKKEFGRNLLNVLNNAPVKYVRAFLASHETPDGQLLQPPHLKDNTQDQPSDLLRDFLREIEGELVSEIDRVCAIIVELSEDKGVRSLDTVAAEKLSGDDYETFEQVPDPLCKSLWVHTQFQPVFQDAASFHSARRYREHKKMYAAYEADGDATIDVAADEIDGDNLCRELERRLDLRAKSTASVIDLPKTKAYPPSVMIAIRHPGALSSIKDHRTEGGWRTYYYRPSHEAIIIYTPSLGKIEVCAESFDVRKAAAETFAEAALGQNLSNKPLAQRNFNMDRFRLSFELDLPDFEDVEIFDPTVIEAEMPLGSWRQRLSLKVAKSEDIEQILDTHLSNAKRLIRSFGFSRIVIAVGYTRRIDGVSGTLRLAVSGGNTSNVLSQTDPFLRELGCRLLEHWGLTDEVRPLTENQKSLWLAMLLDLYELPGKEVSGTFFTAARVDPKPLIRAKLIEKKSRQIEVLIDDDDDGPIEVEVATGAQAGTLSIKGSHGEQRGLMSEADALVYTVNRDYLAEIVLKSMANAISSRGIEIVDDHLAALGKIQIDGSAVPVYLTRQLGNLKVFDTVENNLRQRRTTGPGIVLTAIDDAPQYLGPNVVISLGDVWSTREDGHVILDADVMKSAFATGRSLVGRVQIAQVIQHGTQSATLVLPGEDPLSLQGAGQVKLFERLVEAANRGIREMRTADLMVGVTSDNPRQLFSKKWEQIYGVYISHGSSNRFWMLGKPMPELDLEFV